MSCLIQMKSPVCLLRKLIFEVNTFANFYSRCCIFLLLLLGGFHQQTSAGNFVINGSTLTLDLDVASQTVTVVSTGTTYTFTLSGGATNTWTGTTNANVTVSGTVLTVTASGLSTFSDIYITDSQTGNKVTFNSSGANAFSDNFYINLDNGGSASAVTFNGSTNFSGSNAVSITTTAYINFSSASSLTTVNGNLTLSANMQNPSNSMSFSGITVDAATVEVTGTGILSMTGRAGNFNHMAGIKIASGGLVKGGTTGTASITGYGHSGSASLSYSHGVWLTSNSETAVSTISSNGANVVVTGNGIFTSAAAINIAYSTGVSLSNLSASSANFALITAGGSGSVTVTGQGGVFGNPTSNVTSYCSGIRLISGTVTKGSSRITSNGGNVTVIGTGGGADSLTSQNPGIFLSDSTLITAGGNGTVTVTGSGGLSKTTALSQSHGIYIQNKASILGGPGSGSTLVTGYGGGKLNSSDNNGVVVTGGIISSLGTGDVTVRGYGGSLDGLGNNNYGIQLSSSANYGDSKISSNGGNVLVEGFGGGNTSTLATSENTGVYIHNTQNSLDCSISAGGNGTVTVLGKGGQNDSIGGGGNCGVRIKGLSNISGRAFITSNGGTVSVTGYGGGGDSTSPSALTSGENVGVTLSLGAYISAGGIGDVYVKGIGGNNRPGAKGSNNTGLFIDTVITRSANSVGYTSITSNGGNVFIEGTAGGGSTANSSITNSHGVFIKGLVSASGTGNVNITGTGPSNGSSQVGVYLANSNLVNSVFQRATITTGGGSVNISALGGSSGLSTNANRHGLWVSGGALITAGNKGSVNIIGTAASGASGSYGVHVSTIFNNLAATITSGGGPVNVTGYGGGGASTNSNIGVTVSNSGIISAGDTATVTVIGYGGTSSTGTMNYGVLVEQGTSPNFSRITSNGGNVVVSGTGGGAGASTNSNYGVYVLNAMLSVGGSGNLTVNGIGSKNVTGGTFNNHGILLTNSKVTSAGGNVFINATEGEVNNSNNIGLKMTSAASITTVDNGGDIVISTNSFNSITGCSIAAPVSGKVIIKPRSSNTEVRFTSTGDIKNSIYFDAAEISTLSGGSIQIGDSITGPITISQAVAPAVGSNLKLEGASLSPKLTGAEITMGAEKTLDLSVDTMKIGITGVAVNTQYDQLRAKGIVSLSGVNLSLSGAYTPVSGNVFTIVDSAVNVTGAFNGLTDGSIFAYKGRNLMIKYSASGVTLTDTTAYIITHPSNKTVNLGQSVSFSASVGGYYTAVQWQVSSDGGSTWNDIPGATTSNLSFTATSSDNGKRYKAIFTYPNGVLTTNSATLTVISCSPSVSTETLTACDSLVWHGTTYKSSNNSATWDTTNAGGCDSTVTLNLTIKNSSTSSSSASACGSYTWQGTTYTTSGAKKWTTTNAVGCDSVVTLNLTITPSTSNSSSASACDNYTWSENATTYTQSGSYSSVSGCATKILNLTITTSTSSSSSVSACNSYTWSENGATYTQSGSYTSITGCATKILNLIIKNSSTSSSSASACDSYTWQGTTYTTSGAKIWTTTNSVGCDSVVTLNLTITTSTSSSSSASACDSYTWSENGISYTQSGSYTSISGCATKILNLTIASSTSSSSSASACDSYTWSENGTSYTQSGSYTSVSGCATKILNLTITSSTGSNSSASACDSYTWSENGATYTQSGSYTSVTGCATKILNLTITTSTTNNISDTACDSYTWSENGTTYTQSGSYTSVTGCATKVLNLTISTAETSAQVVENCGNYIWHGNTYTQSGVYTWTGQNSAGCDSTVTLSLTLVSSISLTETVSSCLPYDWHGATYGVTGIYTWTGTSAENCDSTIILDLTITREIPAKPASITQETVINECGNRVYRFRAADIGPGLQYLWFLPNAVGGVVGVTVDSGTVFSKTIRLSFATNGAGLATDSIFAASFMGCCRSNLTAAKIRLEAITLPAAPLDIIIQAIETKVCGARKYRFKAPALLAAKPGVVVASGWQWSFVGSLSNSMTIDSGTLNSQTLVVIFSSNEAAKVEDSIRVRYTSSCGNTPWYRERLTNTLLLPPNPPAEIKINAVSVYDCGNKVYRYSAPSLPGATLTNGAADGYLWTFTGALGANATIDSGTINSQKILVRFTSNADAAAGDSVKLRYTSGCGSSAWEALKLTNFSADPPTNPAFTITAVSTKECGNRVYRYSGPALAAKSLTTVAATGYLWTFTGTLGANASIDSGSVDSRVILVSFTSNEAAKAGDSVRLAFASTCGNSKNTSKILTNTALVIPVPASITQKIVSDVCGARVYRYTAPALPSATTAAVAATGYAWTLPFGIVGSTGTLDSGTLSSQVIRIKYTSNAAAGTGDSIKLAFVSGCGTGTYRAVRLTNTAKGGCPSSAGTVMTKSSETPDNSGMQVNVFPNPSTDQFRLQLSGSLQEASYKVVITDAQGKTISTYGVPAIRALEFGSKLIAGTYLVRVVCGKEERVTKIIKQ